MSVSALVLALCLVIILKKFIPWYFILRELEIGKLGEVSGMATMVVR